MNVAAYTNKKEESEKMKYGEIFKLEKMLNEAKIPHAIKQLYDNCGFQIVYPDFGKPIIYVMETCFNKEDSLAIYGSLKQSLSSKNVSAEDVFERIKKHYSSLKNREKEKLVKLLKHSVAVKAWKCDEGIKTQVNLGEIADYLIENGVVVP